MREHLTPLRLLIGVLLAVLAAAMVLQWRNDSASEDYSGVRGAQLVELLKSLDATNARLADQIDELAGQRDELKSSNETSAAAEKAARKRADALAILAGTAVVTGEGVTLTIDAEPGAVTAVVLLDAVNELRDAGAESIALNSLIRVVAQTYFLDDTDGTRVSGRLIQAPFVIDAIGDKDTLAEAMRFRGGLVDQVEARGGSVRIVERDHIKIDALAEQANPEFAKPTRK
jgi:uncharacterized protein YlxW (UPF0749 family)